MTNRRIARELLVSSKTVEVHLTRIYAKLGVRSRAELRRLDAKGKMVRKFSSKKEAEAASPGEEEFGVARTGEKLPAEEGLNRFVWDMRGETPLRVPGAVNWGGREIGPLVVPGTYQIKLTAGGKSFTAAAEIQKDPRVNVSQADLEKQYELAASIRDRVSAGNEAVNQIRSLREQLDGLKKRLGAETSAKAVLDAADTLKTKIDAVEEKIVQPKSQSLEDTLNYPIQVANQLVRLQGTVESADTASTAQSYVVFDELNARLETQLTTWRDIQSTELVALNELMKKNNIDVSFAETDENAAKHGPPAAGGPPAGAHAPAAGHAPAAPAKAAAGAKR